MIEGIELIDLIGGIEEINLIEGVEEIDLIEGIELIEGGGMGLLGTTKKPTEEGGLLCLMRMIISK
ncbi:MAG: hypothetical protein IKK04_04635 [Bacteroidales bacterium]|nr:hypothetical protein [Bacteroidales bacterium]